MQCGITLVLGKLPSYPPQLIGWSLRFCFWWFLWKKMENCQWNLCFCPDLDVSSSFSQISHFVTFHANVSRSWVDQSCATADSQSPRSKISRGAWTWPSHATLILPKTYQDLSQVDACTQSSQQRTYCCLIVSACFVIWWLYQTKLWTARSHTFQQSVMDTKPDCLHRSGMARRVHINSHGELLEKSSSSTSMITKVSTCDLASCHLTWTLLPSMNFRIRAVQLGMQAWLHNPGTFAPSASWRMISKAIWDSLVLVHHFLEVAFSHSHHSKSRSILISSPFVFLMCAFLPSNRVHDCSLKIWRWNMSEGAGSGGGVLPQKQCLNHSICMYSPWSAWQFNDVLVT